MESRRKKEKKVFLSLLTRYLILLLLAVPNFLIFYIVFTPLTIYPLLAIFGIFFETSLIGNSLFLNNLLKIELVASCIAGPAYYLLLVLNLSLKDINTSKRIKMVAFSFLFFLMANILRIFVLGAMAFHRSSFFNITHKFSWYFLSTALVVLVWFVEVKLFKVREIPFTRDIDFLYKKSLLKK